VGIRPARASTIDRRHRFLAVQSRYIASLPLQLHPPISAKSALGAFLRSSLFPTRAQVELPTLAAVPADFTCFASPSENTSVLIKPGIQGSSGTYACESAVAQRHFFRVSHISRIFEMWVIGVARVAHPYLGFQGSGRLVSK
jgi:hypothetical protein